jgi:starch synthase (maltosyl-transferring)
MTVQTRQHVQITQEPSPGQRSLCFRGDRMVFRLHVDAFLPGVAYVRTNIGQASTIRLEIIREVELNEAPPRRDWFDIPMPSIRPGLFEAVIPLNEVGHFEAKCLFMPDGQNEPLWPEGPNSSINVEPADTVCGNIIYNAFVRQFGPHKNCVQSDLAAVADCVQTLDSAGYTVIPPSGSFRDLIAELDFIMGDLGCRLLQLLPIHPTPTTFARMGRYGSPYAALSFTAVDPALAVFDPAVTPLEQFIELVDAVHAREGKIIIDIAINHTGWAASLHETHPHWLSRKENGEIENPGAWGVIWEDLTRLDFRHKDLWQYMADIFLTWCRRGVDGFRCDAGYMIPMPAWQYIIAKVRDQFPDTLFLLEGLGGKIEVTRDLLNRANFNWAYSELFQNYDRGQIEWYLPEALDIAATDGITVHFAETHDNPRLAATSKVYARMRTALCALLAPHGTFGFANGVEWLATEKINVHEACALNWGAEDNQVDAIARLSRLLKIHPAFGPQVTLRLISFGEGAFIAFKRLHEPSGNGVVVVVNLDTALPLTAGWDRTQSEFLKNDVVDLLTGQPKAVTFGKRVCRVELAPGQALCLANATDAHLFLNAESTADLVPPAVVSQRLRAKALQVMALFDPKPTLNPDHAIRELQADPDAFCRRLDPAGGAPRVVPWQHPTDLRRHVMVPPGHMVLVRAADPFHARIVEGDRVLAIEKSLLDDDGNAFILFPPLARPDTHTLRCLEITTFSPHGHRHDSGQLLYLTDGHRVRVRTTFSRSDCHQLPLLAIGTNGRGALMRVHADWRHLISRYDALLAANLHPSYPEDRRVMFTRCRAWIVYQGYSQEIKLDGLEQFGFDYTAGAWWRYQMLTGQGEHIILQVRAAMAQDRPNCVALQFHRLASTTAEAEMADDKAVTLIVRPEIENRNFHHCTKAFTGPEEQFPAAVHPIENGFRFAPDPGHALVMQVDQGRFAVAPEWYYMVERPMEAERGLDAHSDLFGPGYFSCQLNGDQSITLTAQVQTDETAAALPLPTFDPRLPEVDLPLETALAAALDQYVVRRDAFNTVIAGYPWFLDWGRDTLIVVRGLVAAGKLATSKAILVQFAQFEERGTLPNMIRGNDAGNRDTSDAPLWFFTACADLVAAEGRDHFLEQRCNGRSIRDILKDMATALISGTANGIGMDPASGLIFSPSHFTWMDTNYPAGTPRQGYPIEIQALWHAALKFLARIDTGGRKRWSDLAHRVQSSIETYFWQPERGYLSDCLLADPGQSAAAAQPDDALRPNQLLAVTLGTIKTPALTLPILNACQRLLVPGAIRSLADQPVKVPLAVNRDGVLLNDPLAPYRGQYRGDEDTQRKPAYHNGTAWTWQFPLFCEAWAACHGDAGRDAALAWLSSSVQLINSHCAGHVPEILDGDAPHRQRGCDAQAWGVSELLRVWKKLTDPASVISLSSDF